MMSYLFISVFSNTNFGSILYLTNFQLLNNDEASTSYEVHKLSYTKREMRIVNQPP